MAFLKNRKFILIILFFFFLVGLAFSVYVYWRIVSPGLVIDIKKAKQRQDRFKTDLSSKEEISQPKESFSGESEEKEERWKKWKRYVFPLKDLKEKERIKKFTIPEQEGEYVFTFNDLEKGKNDIEGKIVEKVIPLIIKGIEEKNLQKTDRTISLEILKGKGEKCLWRFEGELINEINPCQMSWQDQPEIAQFLFNGREYVILSDFSFGAHESFFGYYFYIFDEQNSKLVKDKPFSILVNTRSSGGWGVDTFNFIGYKDNLYLFGYDLGRSSLDSEAGGVTVNILKNNQLINNFFYESATLFGGIHPTVGGLIIKDQDLFLKVKNSFCFYIGLEERTRITVGEFLSSLFPVCVDEYYRLDPSQLVKTNKEFKNIYLVRVEKLNHLLADETKWQDYPVLNYSGYPLESAYPGLSINNRKNWLKPLLERTLNYIFAGQKDLGWQTAEEDFNNLSLQYPLPTKDRKPFITFPEIREKVENLL